ncbi:MAG: MFS transporter [Gammaproteobacteria bacterium]
MTVAHAHWRMLLLAMSAQVAVSIIIQGVPTLAPFLQADLGLTRGQVGLFNSALMCGSLIAMFAAGWIVDVKGERVALVGGNLVVGCFCFAMLATDGFLTALAVMFGAGIGGAFPTPAGSKAVMGWFPLHQRGTAMGIRQTGIPLGGALAAALLPAIALAAGWRTAVAAGGIGCFVTAALCAWAYRNPPENEMPVLAKPARSAMRLRDRLTRDLLLLGLAGAVLTLGQFTLITYLALYLKETQGIPVAISATLLVLAQIAGAAGRILWGVWSDRLFQHRRKPALLLANSFAAIGALALGWLPMPTPHWLLYVLVAAYAFNTLGWHGCWVSLLVETSGSTQQGRTVGLGMTIMYPGIILLPPLFGWFVDTTHSWPWAWTLLSGVLLLGTALLVPVREQKELTPPRSAAA